ncbi:hypothetical protein DFJ73DRAFT_765703 [Zopfochytrium polystomum]|nr:hypothetical protein DFJ73DRAFT_765703 [Zopfochytrium polystomum]
MIGGKTPAATVKRGRGRPPKLRVMDTPVVNNTTTEPTAVTTEGLPAGLLQIGSPVPAAIQGLETAMTNQAKDMKEASDMEALGSGLAATPGDVARWTTAMVKTLLKSKEKVHHGYFTSKSDNKAKAKGWANVALDINAAHDINLSKTQVANKYERMIRKWRDNGPNGSETVQTGNNPPDPAKVMSDEEMILMSQYFPQARGADLGQAKTAGKRKKNERDDGEAALASAISAGMIAMADSFKTLGSNSRDDSLKSMLKEQTEAFKETTKGMKDLIAFMIERERKRDEKE